MEETIYRHDFVRIALIVSSIITFIITCSFNGLASSGSNGIFRRRTGDISDGNLTDFTPAGWTFSIWGIIYFWQAAWLLYAVSRIFRKSKKNYLYLEPDTLPWYVFGFYIINLILNIIWLVVWDREEFGGAVLIIFLMFLTVISPMIITHVRLQSNRSSYIKSNLKTDIWLVRAFVHNGFAIYGTWLYLATLLNLTIWIARIHDRTEQSIREASTAALTLVLIGIIAYFVCENFIFYSSMAYTFTPWFVLIFALCGIMSKNKGRGLTEGRNQSFVMALLVISCVLAAIRLVLFGFRYVKGRIPTRANP